jgi:hypothetical protein
MNARIQTSRTARWTRCLVALALIASMSSCATSYGEKGLFGGFEETRLDANTMRVHFQGNGYTAKQTVEDYTILRCAELTEEHGFDWFLIVDDETEGKDTQVHSGSFNSSSTSGVASVNSYGNVNYGSTTQGWTSPSSTFNIRKYDSSVVIKMFAGEKPEEAFNAYSAADVIKYVGPRVKRRG